MIDDVQASARTAVLTNSDLLYIIFAFVAAPRTSGFGTKWDKPSRLAPCLTVCRGFNEIAIRLLWRDLSSLFPLWHLLAPRDASLSREEQPNYLDKVISARLYEDPVVWERFLWHATLVRHITNRGHFPSDSPETDVSHLLLIQDILSKNGGKPALPLLQSILWVGNELKEHSLVLFFASTLRSAAFSFQSTSVDEETHVLLLRSLHQSSPSLEKLTIGSEYHRSDGDFAVGPRVVQELLSFDRLRQLTVHSGSQLLGPATFLALISKPGLTSLSVQNISGPVNASFSPILVRDILELSIEGTVPTLLGIFKLVRFKALESAKIGIENITHVEHDIEHVLKAFTYTLTRPNTLRGLALSVYDVHDLQPTAEGAVFSLRHFLRPVLPLREVRSFTISTIDSCFKVDIADIVALTGAWPTLERLELDVATPSSADALSLDVLHYIHAHCPHLRELDTHSIYLPVLGVHAILAPLDRPGLPPHALRWLWGSCVYVYRPEYKPGTIVPEHAEALARYLLELFPALDTEMYKYWVPRTSGREPGAPPNWYDGRKVLACVYKIASDREMGRQ